MIVLRTNFKDVLGKLLPAGERAVDVETTGLKWYAHDRLFSIIIADDSCSYYFNFNAGEDHLGKKAPTECTLPIEWLEYFQPVFQNPDSLWFAHNAKFDLAMLAKDGLWVAGKVHCTEVMARLLDSNFMKYNLASCVERMAASLRRSHMAKDDAVYDYAIKHKLYKDVEVRGKEKSVRELHYHKIPFEMIVKYGINDGTITQELARFQQKRMTGITDPRFLELVENERKLTKTALSMAWAGIPYDEDYVKNAMEAEIAEMSRIDSEYKGFTGQEFTDSGVQFAKYFDSVGIPYKVTDKGNPRFDEYAMESMDHPVVELIKARRDSAKKVSTYYSSFLYYGHEERIFADMRQAGTATGRVSYREPNMQNIPKPDEDDPENLSSAQVRGCFKPGPDYCFFMPDYDQMEYRMMLDMAEELPVIERILGGLDVHTATAEMMNVTRKTAKTINFLLLYGGGAEKLAKSLGVKVKEAQDLKALYFDRLPSVKKWLFRTMKLAEKQGEIVNWFGRRCKIDKAYAYKAPNYLIQGGCADVTKIAMNRCAALLANLKTKMLLQVHDELLFHVPSNELAICPDLVRTMENVYPHRRLPLTAGASHSWESWGEKKEGYPCLP